MRDNKESTFIKGYKGEEIVESNDLLSPSVTLHVKKKIKFPSFS